VAQSSGTSGYPIRRSLAVPDIFYPTTRRWTELCEAWQLCSHLKKLKWSGNQCTCPGLSNNGFKIELPAAHIYSKKWDRMN
jgi:hypothetical protein